MVLHKAFHYRSFSDEQREVLIVSHHMFTNREREVLIVSDHMFTNRERERY